MIRLFTGDALSVLRTLPDGSVHACVTSPPYFGLRDYGVPGQIGAEKTLEEYVGHLVQVFRELRRVLRPEGTFWLNLGDCYNSNANSSAGRTHASAEEARPHYAAGALSKAKTLEAKPKDLLLVPAQLALALRADGWFLRAEIVWHKPNCLPEPVKDRPTRNHELVYLLTKQAAYFYDQFNAREPAVEAGKKSGNKERRHAKGDVREKDRGFATAGFPWVQGTMRNWRTVWTITNKPFKGAHFATFPVEIPERAILAGTSDFGACLACGAPWRRLVEKVGGPPAGREAQGVPQGEAVGREDTRGRNAELRALYEEHGYPEWKTVGAAPSCAHEGQGTAITAPCTVLDPFCGAGTTGLVAGKLGRHFIGVEINPTYVQIAAERLRSAGLEVEVGGEVVPELEGVAEQAPLLVG